MTLKYSIWWYNSYAFRFGGHSRRGGSSSSSSSREMGCTAVRPGHTRRESTRCAVCVLGIYVMYNLRMKRASLILLHCCWSIRYHLLLVLTIFHHQILLNISLYLYWKSILSWPSSLNTVAHATHGPSDGTFPIFICRYATRNCMCVLCGVSCQFPILNYFHYFYRRRACRMLDVVHTPHSHLELKSMDIDGILARTRQKFHARIGARLEIRIHHTRPLKL